jgi:hypothetical protein
VPPADPAPHRRFALSAGFVDHDARFAGSAQITVELAEPPTWTEAERILYPVLREQITANSGAGEWWPSFSRIDVRELLD